MVYIGTAPYPVTVTTRIVPFLVENPYQPSFATVAERQVDRRSNMGCLPCSIFSALPGFFPTCQVRVVRFYVSTGPPSSSSSSFSSSCRPPQLRSCEFSVACWTPTAILWVQCGVPDRNCDPASSVWRPGPQPRSCEFSVASRTPTAILWVQCGVPDLKYCVRKFVRKNDRRYVRKNDRRYVRRNVKKICQKICQKECQKICQKICQKECQKICQKECQKICQKEW